MEKKENNKTGIIVPSRVPENYSLQPTNHNCGAYCLHTILTTFDIQNLPQNPLDLLPRDVRLSGTTTGKDLYPRIFMNYGLYAELKSAQELTDIEKVNIISSSLSRDLPVMCIINKFTFAHWVTVWGIDQANNYLYVHDPSKIINSKKLPVGNSRWNINQFLKAWKGPESITRKGFQHFSYIQIGT